MEKIKELVQLVRIHLDASLMFRSDGEHFKLLIIFSSRMLRAQVVQLIRAR